MVDLSLMEMDLLGFFDDEEEIVKKAIKHAKERGIWDSLEGYDSKEKVEKLKKYYPEMFR